MYKLERKSVVGTAIKEYKNTIKSACSLVLCSSLGTIGIVELYKFGDIPNLSKMIYVAPSFIAFAYTLSYVASKVHENFINDRDRVHELVEQLNKKDKTEFIPTSNFASYEFARDAEKLRMEPIKENDKHNKVVDISPYIESRNIIENVKRKSLNNGIFKPNDKY